MVRVPWVRTSDTLTSTASPQWTPSESLAESHRAGHQFAHFLTIAIRALS